MADARFLVSPRVVAVILWILVMGPAQVAAQESAVLWLVDGDDSAAAEVLNGAEEALAQERSSHLFGEEALGGRAADRSRPLPSCAFGVEACPPPQALVFDALDLGLLIRISLSQAGSTVEGNYEMVDRRGENTLAGRVSAPSWRELGFALVRELFDAVGVVSFESTPPGAHVYIDGESRGITPFSAQLAVGAHPFRMELDNHEAVDGEVVVRSGAAHRVEEELSVRPGVLRISGAPDGAMVFVNDEEIGAASDELTLDSGTVHVEIRARGYETLRQEVTISPDEPAEVAVELTRERFVIGEVDPRAIADHPFQLEIGLHGGVHQATYHDASGTLDGETYQFQGWLQDGMLAEDGALRRLMLPRGVQAQAAWEGRYLGVTALGISFGNQPLNHNARLRPRGDGPARDVVIQRMTTLQLRPLQIRGRYFYENLAIYGQAGLGLAFKTLQALESADDEEFFRLRRVEVSGGLEIGVRYHFHPRFSVGGHFRHQRYFSDGLGAENTLGIVVGMGLRQVPFVRSEPPEAL